MEDVKALKGLQELYGTNTGVSAQVLSNITGATSNTGFTGINGKFNRQGLLFFGADIQSNVRFTRVDATEESKKDFPKQWQEMVKTIFDNADKVIELKVITPE